MLFQRPPLLDPHVMLGYNFYTAASGLLYTHGELYTHSLPRSATADRIGAFTTLAVGAVVDMRPVTLVSDI